MAENPERPEHIDLAALVAAQHAASEALDQLYEQPFDAASVAAFQAAVHRLQVLADDNWWDRLAGLVSRLDQARFQSPEQAEPDPALADLFSNLAAQTARGRPDDSPHHSRGRSETQDALAVVRVEVRVFAETARQFADQRVPSRADTGGRRRWVAVAKVILEKAVDLLTNIAVAAAFTMAAVQTAAQRAALETVEQADRALSYLGPALPSMLAMTAVATQAVMSVRSIREACQASRDAEQRLVREPQQRNRADLNPRTANVPVGPDWPHLDEPISEASERADIDKRSLVESMDGPVPATKTEGDEVIEKASPTREELRESRTHASTGRRVHRPPADGRNRPTDRGPGRGFA